MIFSIIQSAILSIILIALVHYSYIFLKENLTTPKIKDLINKPIDQYNDIYKDLECIKETSNVDMKSELQNYLKTLSNEVVDDKKPILATSPEDYSFENNNQGLQFQSI